MRQEPTDKDFHGEIQVILIHSGSEPFIIERGMCIAQAVMAPVRWAQFQWVDSIPSIQLGEGGFGSRGLLKGYFEESSVEDLQRYFFYVMVMHFLEAIPKSIAIGVSGGADRLALTYLLTQWKHSGSPMDVGLGINAPHS